MTVESEDKEPDREQIDPYLSAVERQIGDQKLSDEGVEFVADVARDLTLIGTFGDLHNPQQVRRGKGAVNVLTILGQKRLIEVALRQAAQARKQPPPKT